MRKVDTSGKVFVFPEQADIDLCVQYFQIVQLLDEPSMDNKCKYWLKECVAAYK